MARNPVSKSETLTPSSLSSSATSPSSAQSVGASSAGGITEKGRASDQFETELIKGPGVGPIPDPDPEPVDLRRTHLGAVVGDVSSPEQASVVLKEKVHILHTALNNVGHFSTMAFNDVEQLMADIRWLVSYIRSKV